MKAEPFFCKGKFVCLLQWNVGFISGVQVISSAEALHKVINNKQRQFYAKSLKQVATLFCSKQRCSFQTHQGHSFRFSKISEATQIQVHGKHVMKVKSYQQGGRNAFNYAGRKKKRQRQYKPNMSKQNVLDFSIFFLFLISKTVFILCQCVTRVNNQKIYIYKKYL